MKKVCIITIFYLNSLIAYEIPNLHALREEYNSVICDVAHPTAEQIEQRIKEMGTTQQQIDAMLILAGTNILTVNDDIPLELVGPTVTQWYNENKHLFNVSIPGLLTAVLPPPFVGCSSDRYQASIDKAEERFLDLKKLLCQSNKESIINFFLLTEKIDLVPSPRNKTLKRHQEILATLKDLRVPQTCSDQELDLIAQLASSKDSTSRSYWENRLKTIEQLIEGLEKYEIVQHKR